MNGNSTPPRSAALICVVLGLILFGIILSPPSARRLALDEGGRTQLNADGYNQIVNDIFLRNGWIIAMPPEEGAPESRYTIRLDPDLNDQRITDFVRTSFLGEDILRETPVIWRVENGKVVELDRYAHTVSLPSHPPSEWRGNLLFRDYERQTPQIMLRGDSGVYVLEAPDFNESQSDTDRTLVSAFGTGQRAQNSIIRFFDGVGENQVQVAEVFRWSDRVVVSALADRPYEVFVDAVRLQQNQSRIMARGGSIRFVASGGRLISELRQEENVSPTGALSIYRPWGGERIRSQSAASLARSIEGAMNRLVASEPSRSSVNETVVLTLDSRMQTGLSDMLVDYVDAERARLGDRYTIGVTILDAVNGDILALGSQERRSDENPPTTDVNFRRLAVGSAAKPPIAAAILHYRPSLSTLVIDPATPTADNRLPDIMGTPIPEQNSLNDSLGIACDFGCFIQRSNNRYAAGLMLLATTTDTQPMVAAQYWLGNAPQQQRRLSIYETVQGGQRFIRTGNVVTLDWFQSIRDLYDIDFESVRPGNPQWRNCRGEGRSGDDFYNTAIWNELIARHTEADACVFADVAPSRENFQLDLQHDFRQRMLPVMIGGGDANWTNVAIAQTYARLVTGQRVNARIYADPSPRGPPRRARPFGMRDDMRRLVARSLTLVSQPPGGTADHEALSAALARARAAVPNGSIGFFSKTGTPELEEFIADPPSQAINGLIQLDRLELRTDGLLVLNLDRVYVPGVDNRDTIARALMRSADAREAISGARTRAITVARRLEAENNGGAEEIARRFQIENDRILVRIRRQPHNQDTREYFGKVFVFVIGAYADGQPTDGSVPPARAYSVAINIQARVDTDNREARTLAIRLGARIIDQLLRPRLAERSDG
jgi:hypothetical protein